MTAQEVGERIRYFREKKNLSKNALATNAGVSPTYVYQVEQGLKCPTVEYLGYLCWGLGITYLEFFSYGTDLHQKDKLAYLTPEQKKLLNDFLNAL